MCDGLKHGVFQNHHSTVNTIRWLTIGKEDDEFRILLHLIDKMLILWTLSILQPPIFRSAAIKLSYWLQMSVIELVEDMSQDIGNSYKLDGFPH